MRTAGFVIVVLLVAVMFVKRGVAWSFGDREHVDPRTAVLAAHGARQVHVESSAGDLRVVAVEGLDEVRVHGTARASSERILKSIKLALRRENDRLVVKGVVPPQSRSWLGRPTRQSLDMVVEVPMSIEADVVDGSGNLEVQGVSALQVKDGSGNLQVIDVRGPVRLTDGSGEVELRGVHGDVLIEDGSGELSVNEVHGSLVVTDGSGSISASRVHGDVLVQNDGSGDIDVAEVGGRFIVTQDRSGAVSYRDVKGTVEIPKKKEHASHE